MRRAALLLIACAPASVQAHTFGQPYTLPVPLWMYAWGASAALVLSFLAAAYFLRSGSGATPESRELPGLLRFIRRWRLVPAARTLAAALLLLTIATALFGSRDPYRNFSMTAFFIYFVLGFTYLTALVGDVYAFANPWRVLADWIGQLVPGFQRGRWRYPERLGAWPALLLYFGFIAFELFAWVRPPSLAFALGGYTLLNLAAAWAFGAEAWFRHGELFAVLLRQLALLAPLDLRRGPDGAGRIALRAPGDGVLQQRPASVALLLFVLFMLSSTAFDGLHATRLWFVLFWQDPTGLATQLFGAAPAVQDFATIRAWFQRWSLAWLTVSPFLYLALYLAAIALARVLGGSRRSVRELALDFAWTLLPIVFVYHFAHYFTLVLSQGPKLPSLLSDPFGWQWNLFGTRELFRAPLIPDLTWTWHIQVGLIVLGHVASVLLAHRVALRVFETRRAALLSQLPMLALMVAFTIAGLWILAQPLQATLVR